MKKQFLTLTVALGVFPQIQATEFQAGAAAVDITPYDFETHPQKNQNGYKNGDPFFDTGTDQKFDYEEFGAFGADGFPGKAGVDDDHDGIVDNCDRTSCKEYLAQKSDDVRDPNKDNYDAQRNPGGTEGDKYFQYLHLGGFSPQYPIIAGNRFATGVHDPIWARTIVFKGANGEYSLLMSTDLPGLAWKHINPVRREIEKKLGIKKENVVITSTHSHYAPDAIGYWSSLVFGHNKRYTDRLRRWMFESAQKAIANLEPAQLKVISTQTYSCVDPITKELKKTGCRIPDVVDEYKKPYASERYDKLYMQSDLRDPIVLNPNILAAQAVSTRTNKTIGTFINYHLHPDMLSSSAMEVSSEYVHYVRQFVERSLGGIAVYFNGTLGCQIGSSTGSFVRLWNEDFQQVMGDDGNPILIDRRDWNKARSLGYEIGFETVQALNQSTFKEELDVKMKTEPVDIQVNNALHLIGTKSVWYYDVKWADRMRHYGPRCLNILGCVRTDISVIDIGPMNLVTLPGEVDPGYFLGRHESSGNYGKFGTKKFPAMPAIADHMRGPYKGILGQANNYLSYLVHSPDNIGWKNFKHPLHYEEFVTVGKNFGDDAANKLMQMLGTDVRYSNRKIYPKK